MPWLQGSAEKDGTWAVLGLDWGRWRGFRLGSSRSVGLPSEL